MKKIFTGTALLSVLLLSLGGCGAQSERQKSGASRDAHGCIPSAGYRWCARTKQCERPWELAKKEHFEKSAEAFDAFCNTKEETR
ncbi:peptidase [Nitratifractor sp.]